jgi:uncharacterized lipoprotein YmbA
MMLSWSPLSAELPSSRSLHVPKLIVHLLLQVEEAELARLLAPQGLVLRDIPVRWNLLANFLAAVDRAFWCHLSCGS